MGRLVFDDSDHEKIIGLIHQRAHNLFATRQLMCSEAVLVVLNRAFDGGLSDELAIRLTSALPEGIGGSGCTCGALSGGVLAIGLFLGRERPGQSGKKARKAAKELHNLFKNSFRSTCCRVLTKKVKDDSAAHFKQCAEFTGTAAAQAAGVIIQAKPELIRKVDIDYLERMDTRIGATVKNIANWVR